MSRTLWLSCWQFWNQNSRMKSTKSEKEHGFYRERDGEVGRATRSEKENGLKNFLIISYSICEIVKRVSHSFRSFRDIFLCCFSFPWQLKLVEIKIMSNSGRTNVLGVCVRFFKWIVQIEFLENVNGLNEISFSYHTALLTSQRHWHKWMPYAQQSVNLNNLNFTFTFHNE